MRITKLKTYGTTTELMSPTALEETSQTVAAIHQPYCCTRELKMTDHGNRSFTKEQEDLMACLLISFGLV